jgi:glycosyltransferase involved in cell wall biosynthesis
VIDERMDLQLIERLAREAPSWQIVMVGPVVKIDPGRLPRRANLHWLGQQSYDILPRLVADWDVCLMPFAINEATRFISPTKTLEYMAAGKPVVSTAIRDVRTLYGETVEIADDHERFIDACRRVLAETPAEKAKRGSDMAVAVSRSSWDLTADAVGDAIDEALAVRTAACIHTSLALEFVAMPEQKQLPALAG